MNVLSNEKIGNVKLKVTDLRLRRFQLLIYPVLPSVTELNQRRGIDCELETIANSDKLRMQFALFEGNENEMNFIPGKKRIPRL